MAVKRILVVDDNHEIRRMVTASIKTLGAEIDVLDVPSAEEALFISATLPLDLIVLDFRLPGMSGLEMVDRLRKQKPETKIILVTGIEDTSTRHKIAEAGVAAYFFKPIEIATFLDAVRYCLWHDQKAVSLPEAKTGKSDVPGAGEQPGASGEPCVSGAPDASRETKVQDVSNLSKVSAVTVKGFDPKIDERLTALKQQVRATSVLLVNETGQVMEVAGNPTPITSGALLLPAIMDVIRACQKVSDALGKNPIENLLYFSDTKQRIYLAPVDPSHAMLVVMSGYFEPDKLGILDRAIHLAVKDLQGLLERVPDAESSMPAEVETQQTELPAEVVVDPQTLASVAEIFSRAKQGSVRQEADGFWEALGENGELEGTQGKGVLSYEQARDMGLAPDDDAQP